MAWGLWTPVTMAAAVGDRSVRVADPAIFAPGTGIKLTGPGDAWEHHWNHVERIEGDTLHLARPLTVSPPSGSIAQRMHSLVTAESVENVGVRDLVLEGFPDDRKPAGGAFYLAALHTNESRKIDVRRVVVRDWHSDAFSFQAGSALVVEGNRIEGNGRAGVEMIGGPKNHRNTVVRNTIRDNSRAAPGKHPGIRITAVWAESPTGAIVRDNVVESTLAEPTQWIGIEEVHAQPMQGKEDRADPTAGLVLVDESTIEGNRVTGHKTADIVVRGRSSRAAGNVGRVIEERP